MKEQTELYTNISKLKVIIEKIEECEGNILYYELNENAATEAVENCDTSQFDYPAEAKAYFNKFKLQRMCDLKILKDEKEHLIKKIADEGRTDDEKYFTSKKELINGEIVVTLRYKSPLSVECGSAGGDFSGNVKKLDTHYYTELMQMIDKAKMSS